MSLMLVSEYLLYNNQLQHGYLFSLIGTDECMTSGLCRSLFLI
ncbi:MAG: hypothetical protein GPOALKHO_001843 [Sodalis sp.]|nr:MAG: hypothetical protein GPOALKHO_001843 [Sodalis sp.]